MIFINGNAPSSKNSKRIITITNKKSGKKTTRLINSEVTEKYIKNSKADWILNKNNFKKMIKDKEKPYKIELFFIRDSRRKFDYFNFGNSRKIQLLNDFGDVNKMVKIGGENGKYR